MSVRRTVALLCVVLSLATPVAADPGGATLSGIVRSGTEHAPLAGARVYAGDPETGEVFPSAPTAADGQFEIGGLPPATYQLAVESGAGLYLIESPVALDAGARQQVGIAVAPASAVAAPAADGTAAPADGLTPRLMNAQGSGGLWNNPLTAALLVVGLAFLFGWIIEGATDDDDTTEEPASPTYMGS
jgi:hypothetical protein